MKKISETGRSMIEMLGVLSIIGVLSVGGLHVINSAREKQRQTQAVSDIADFARRIKKLACQYDDGYSSYNTFAYKSNAYPTNWTYSTSAKKFIDSNNLKYTLVDGVGVSGGKLMEPFAIIVEGLPQKLCTILAGNNWGNRHSSGFLGLSIKTTPGKASSYDVTPDSAVYPLPLSQAVQKCKSKTNNYLVLSYSGCRS